MFEKDIAIECLTRVNDNGKVFLDSHYITFLVYSRARATDTLPESGKERLAARLNQILKPVGELLLALDDFFTPKIDPEISEAWKYRTDFKHELLRSEILSCFYAISEVVFYAHQKMNLGIFQTFPFEAYLPLWETTRARMHRIGFCPTTIEKLKDAISTMEWTCWWAKHTRYALWEDHSRCHTNRCSLDQVGDKIFGLQHTSSCSRTDCTIIRPSMTKIRNALQKGLIPFITLLGSEPSSDEDVLVTVHSLDSIDSFVAISHVWRHGLGSRSEHGLCKCQVKKLTEAVPRARVGAIDATLPF